MCNGMMCQTESNKTKSKSKSKYHYARKIVERHHANSKMLINKTILKYTT